MVLSDLVHLGSVISLIMSLEIISVKLLALNSHLNLPLHVSDSVLGISLALTYLVFAQLNQQLNELGIHDFGLN